MTRLEFISALRAKLSMLPADEKEDAVQFYEEYFDEAGPENEQAVIEELGSPDAVAEKILSGEGKIVQRGWQNGSSSQHPRNKSQKSGNALPWVLLAIVTSPFWLSALAVLVCVAAALLMMLAAVVMVALALAVTCLVCLGVAVWLIPQQPLNGLMVLSIGMIGLGSFLIVIPLIMLLVKKGFPALGRGWNKLSGWVKKNAKKAWVKIKNIG